MSRIRANNIVNTAGTGAPTFPNGAIISGIATINADIDSNSNLTANQITSLQSIGVGTGATVTNPADNELAFNTNGSERLRIDSSGNIGIGTDNPSTNIHIYDSSQPTIRLDRSDAPRNNFVASWNADELVLAADHANSGGDSRIRFFVDGNEKVRIDDNGNIVMVNSGTGIDFSATSDGSGTTTSELLDDYEEGTFTPTIEQGFDDNAGGAATFHRLSGRYTKIGNTVFVDIYMRFNVAYGTGNIILIGGLPFAISNLSYGSPTGQWTRGSGTSSYQDVINTAIMQFYGSPNNTRFSVYYDGGNEATVSNGTSVTNKYIIGGFWYQTDS